MRLWADTSAIFRGGGRYKTLALLAQKKACPLYLPAQVHLELCRESRVRLGADFDPLIINDALAQLGVTVADFRLDRTKAEEWSRVLAAEYGSKDDWRKAKEGSLRARLKEGEQILGETPFTTDWYVALEVRGSPDDVIVVDDEGPEWRALRDARRALSYQDAIAWLTELPDRQ